VIFTGSANRFLVVDDLFLEIILAQNDCNSKSEDQKHNESDKQSFAIEGRFDAIGPIHRSI